MTFLMILDARAGWNGLQPKNRHLTNMWEANHFQIAAHCGRSLGVSEGSPGSREAEGEGGEGFYVAEAAGAAIYL